MENKNSTEIENETLENLKDRRTVDDLLGCLLFLSKYHNRETSAESLTYGLPIHKTSMNVSMFHQASSRIGFSTRTVNRKNLNDILFFDNLTIEMKGYPKKNVELKHIIINSIYTIDNLFKKLPEYKERFTDIITINSQKEFFQFLAENNLSITEVLSPFRY